MSRPMNWNQVSNIYEKASCRADLSRRVQRLGPKSRESLAAGRAGQKGWVSSLKGAGLDQALPSRRRDDDVVDELQADQVGAAREAPRDREIVGARGRLAARVVVRDQDCGDAGFS